MFYTIFFRAMPGGQTKFQAGWLEYRDKNDDFISNWCAKGKTENEAYCTICRSYFSVANSGFAWDQQWNQPGCRSSL